MTVDVDIARTPSAPAHARRAVRALGDVIDPAIRDDVVLLVSELVTNGVKYGDNGDLRLQVDARGPRTVRVEVVDQGTGFVPKPRVREITDAGGWGLHLVQSLADRWGVHEGSTHVWFEIDRAA